MADFLSNEVFPSILSYLRSDSFVRGICSGQQHGQKTQWEKVIIQKVLIKGSTFVQFCFFEQKKDIRKNISFDALEEYCNELFTKPFRNIILERSGSTLHIQVSKKGKVLVSENKSREKVVEIHPQNREKNYLLAASDPFLYELGITTQNAIIKSGKEKKFREIESFVEIVSETYKKQDSEKKSKLFGIDCGCGSAYLTFALYHYFNNILSIPLQITGIDIHKELLESRREKIRNLSWTNIDFIHASIATFTPLHKPDIVISLHACDTATDDAILQAIRWGAKFVFVAPCCHHDLQIQLQKEKGKEVAFTPLYRHGILMKQFGDILTDTFRALILRILGYQTDVIEFVPPELTNRNILLRAVRSKKQNTKDFLTEYAALKKMFGVTPYLEQILKKELGIVLDETVVRYTHTKNN